MTGHAPARLEVDGVSKTFGSNPVLAGARVLVRPGEIHGLIGANGSGKSTLVKILTGYHAPDPGGSIRVDGDELHLPVRWSEARQAGIAVVHQDLGLLDQLTVAENVGVGSYKHSRWLRRIDWRHEAGAAAGLLGRLDAPVPPDTPVGELPASARAAVAIARALRHHRPGHGLVILDEATRLLAGDDLKRFHEMLRNLARQGTSVLMVSHNLEEVGAVTDRVTILRDGLLAGEGLVTAQTDEHEMARRMLGKTVTVPARRTAVRGRPTAVTVTGLRSAAVAQSCDFTIRRGEILGLTGLPGSGFERIPYLLAGAEPAQAGVIRVGSRELDLRRASVLAALRAGIVLVPERRDRDGLALTLSVSDNISLPSLRSLGSAFYVSRRRERAMAERTISRLRVLVSSPLQLVQQLSGGNQQKVLLGKWLALQPNLLILHEPTQAVDVGARLDLLRVIRGAADDGVSVLLASIQPADLVAACDRILVRHEDGGMDEVVTGDPDHVLEAVYGRIAAS